MKKYLTIVAAAIFIASCSSDTEINKTEKSTRVPILLGTTMQVSSTRSNAQDLQTTELTDGASVGVYIYLNGKTETTSSYGYKNLAYTAQNPATLPTGVTPGDLTLVTASEQPYFPDDKSKTLDIYAFSPRTGIYTGTAELNTLTAQDIFATKADQTAKADYLASDFVWGKAAAVTNANVAAGKIEIPLKHKLSKVNINVASADGTTLSRFAKARIKLNGVILQGTVNLSTGAVSTRSGSTASSVTLTNDPDVTTSTTSFSDGGSPAKTYAACTSSAVIIPQSVAASNSFITVELWDAAANSGSGAYTTPYNVKTTATTVFAAEKVYTYNIIVTSQGLSLTTTITNWDNTGITPVIGTAE